jgi:hypothetical protein
MLSAAAYPNQSESTDQRHHWSDESPGDGGEPARFAGHNRPDCAEAEKAGTNGLDSEKTLESTVDEIPWLLRQQPWQSKES